ncbi:MAG: hypothetical protein QGI68_18715 [Pseudomonadales bacterium]|jgi:hypothetical protein|nr:hypothetical protein [Pseudomonadales bacterium]MDP7360309.1 hypothetical protein [Pseudomonadales bacterium]MDP7597579.1 hypothetical protein [Pseudomonadales bacterium]HJN50793.1 hypothetical protein [Pseudomonadales bacterium]
MSFIERIHENDATGTLKEDFDFVSGSYSKGFDSPVATTHASVNKGW